MVGTVRAVARWLVAPDPSRHPLAAAAPGAVASRGAGLTPTVGMSGIGWGPSSLPLAPFTWAPPPGPLPWSRDAACAVPTVARAQTLICATVGALPLRQHRVTWGPGATAPTVTPLPPETWFDRPDPAHTRQWLLAWTTDDLMFHGRAYWYVTERTAGYPSRFTRIPAAELTVDADGQPRYGGVELDPANVIEFLSPTDGVLAAGWRAIFTALELDGAAERFAGCEVPAGWLKQTSGETMGADELAQLADTFAAARRANAIAAINEAVDYHESQMDPSKMQLTEARGHQALELARICNVPPYLVGAPTGTGMTYQNAQQARGDLVDFGALPYVTAIEQTLSGPNVTPRGRVITLEVEAWTRTTSTPAPASPPPPPPARDDSSSPPPPPLSPVSAPAG